MHNKLIVADNRIAILGGRNLGDEYFGLNSSFNFLDIDVVGVGPVARESSELFDHFWNNPLVVSASAFGHDQPEESPQEIADAYLLRFKTSERLENVPIERQNWDDILQPYVKRLHPGASKVVYDTLEADGISRKMATIIPAFSKTAKNELLIVNAYVIPNEDMLKRARDLVQKGVKIKVLTNSLASQDVPAVNSHYGPWRKANFRCRNRALRTSPGCRHQSADGYPADSVGIYRPALKSFGGRPYACLHRIVQFRSTRQRF